MLFEQGLRVRTELLPSPFENWKPIRNATFLDSSCSRSPGFGRMESSRPTAAPQSIGKLPLRSTCPYSLEKAVIRWVMRQAESWEEFLCLNIFPFLETLWLRVYLQLKVRLACAWPPEPSPLPESFALNLPKWLVCDNHFYSNEEAFP